MDCQIKAIDMHSHINHGTAWDVEESAWYSAQLDFILKMNSAAGIEKTICTTYAAALHAEVIEAENEYLFDLVKRTDGLYQWVIIDPKNKATFRQAEHMLTDSKCMGIKLLPSNHNYRLEDYSDELFSFAENYNAVVLIHPKAEADYILPIADKYPRTRFILAHIWGKPHVDAVEYAKHKNVYVDTSGNASIQNGIIEYAVSRVGSERILFGTDTYAAGAQRGRIDYAQISEEDKFNILHGNAVRLFELN